MSWILIELIERFVFSVLPKVGRGNVDGAHVLTKLECSRSNSNIDLCNLQE
jgi:hypothetical protein